MSQSRSSPNSLVTTPVDQLDLPATRCAAAAEHAADALDQYVVAMRGFEDCVDGGGHDDEHHDLIGRQANDLRELARLLRRLDVQYASRMYSCDAVASLSDMLNP